MYPLLGAASLATEVQDVPVPADSSPFGMGARGCPSGPPAAGATLLRLIAPRKTQPCFDSRRHHFLFGGVLMHRQGTTQGVHS